MYLMGPCIKGAYALIFVLIESRFVAGASDESADQAVVAAAAWLALPFLACSIVSPGRQRSRPTRCRCTR